MPCTCVVSLSILSISYICSFSIGGLSMMHHTLWDVYETVYLRNTFISFLVIMAQELQYKENGDISNGVGKKRSKKVPLETQLLKYPF